MASVTSGRDTGLRPSQARCLVRRRFLAISLRSALQRLITRQPIQWTQRMMDEVPRSRKPSTFSTACWRPARLSWLQRCWAGVRGWCPTLTRPKITGHSCIVSRRLISSSSRSSRGAACGLIMAPRSKSVWADLAVADASGSAPQGWRHGRSDGRKTFPVQARCSL